MSAKNFHAAENSNKAFYRLWRVIYTNYITPLFVEKKVLYSYNSKSDRGLSLLVDYIEKRKHMIKNARIYNNQTNTLMMVFDHSTSIMRDATPEEIKNDSERNAGYVQR